ncbi:MAG: Rieske 2Fe-2S domain-containing protein [Candidatus Dormibacteria bacterium]
MPQPRRSAARSRQHRHLPHPSATGRAPVLDHDQGAGWLWLGPPPRSRHLAGWALLPLRAFLGVTFCFAGLQKLANPAFFNASSPVSIQSQLTGAARHSPIHSLLVSLGHVAVPLGLLIAFGELAVGLGALVGLWARWAAAGGAAISFGLFLSVSFNSNPYYTGSDIVFLFAWLPLVIAGAGPLSADAVLSNLARKAHGLPADGVVPVTFSQVRAVCGAYSEGTCTARSGEPCEPGPCPFLAHDPERLRRPQMEDLSRRAFLAKSTVAAGLGAIGVVGGGIVAGIGRLAGGGSPSAGPRNLGAGGGQGSPSTTTTPATPSSTPPSTATPGTTPPGTRLGPASSVPVGGAARFTDPSSGDPALVVQPKGGTFLAFDAVCPHAGCIVEYSSQDRLFICPCHGSEFNGRTGAVEVGPAQSGLTSITIAEGSDGQLYAK